MNLVFTLILYLPLILFSVIAILPSYKINLIKHVALIGTLFLFLISIYILITYSISLNIKDHSWFEFKYYSTITYLFNWQYTIGLDGISILLINLTTLLIIIQN